MGIAAYWRRKASKQPAISLKAGPRPHQAVLRPKSAATTHVLAVPAESSKGVAARSGEQNSSRAPCGLSPGRWIDVQILAFRVPDYSIFSNWSKFQLIRIAIIARDANPREHRPSSADRVRTNCRL